MKTTTVLDYEDDDYAKLLGDAPPRSPSELATDLKGRLAERAKALVAIDTATAALIEAVKAEGRIRKHIRELLTSGGKPVKDMRRDYFSGSDVVDRAQKQLRAGGVMGDLRDDKSIAPPTCASLADHHAWILDQFEKALAGEVPRETFAPVLQEVHA